MSVNFELYKVFISLVENGSMNKAATELNVTTSAVSQNLKLLEEQIGEKLFKRQRQGLLLTNYGKSLYEEIYKNIKSLSISHLKIKNNIVNKVNKLKISTSSALYKAFILPYLNNFKDFDLIVDSHLTNYDQIKSVENDLADFAIIKEFSQPLKNGIESFKIGELNYVFFYNPKLINEANIYSCGLAIKNSGSKLRKNENEQFSKILKKFENFAYLGHDNDIIKTVEKLPYIGFAPKEYLSGELKVIDLGYTKQVLVKMVYKQDNINANKYIEYVRRSNNS